MKITVTFDTLDLQDVLKMRALGIEIAHPGLDVSTPPPPLPVVEPPPPPPAPSAPPTPPPPRVDGLHVPPGGGLRPGPAPAPAADGPLDAAGQPWDARIHAGSKTKTRDGKWRRKRGVGEVETPSSSPLAVVPPPPPPPPPSPPPTNGQGTWESVVHAIQSRAPKYTLEQIGEALRSASIEPTTLHTFPEQYAPAVAVLEAQCPL